MVLAFNPLGTDVYRWSREHPEVSSELHAHLPEECVGLCVYFCVWVIFPSWACRFGVQKGTASFLCVIFKRIDGLCVCV